MTCPECAGHGCDNCADGSVICDECTLTVPAIGFFADDGEEVDARGKYVQALCARCRDELLRGPSAEDLRDARGDLAFHENR